MGCELILLETVGVGQDQIAVSYIADTTIVVVAPGLGDFLQALKSGILEAGDIFVVNKADRPDADWAVQYLESAILMRERKAWRPPVVKTIASNGSGIESLITQITMHQAHCTEKTVTAVKLKAAENELREAIKTRLYDRYFGHKGSNEALVKLYASEICKRTNDPLLRQRHCSQRKTSNKILLLPNGGNNGG
jgi:LAO/AO transport system kinase